MFLTTRGWNNRKQLHGLCLEPCCEEDCDNLIISGFAEGMSPRISLVLDADEAFFLLEDLEEFFGLSEHLNGVAAQSVVADRDAAVTITQEPAPRLLAAEPSEIAPLPLNRKTDDKTRGKKANPKHVQQVVSRLYGAKRKTAKKPAARKRTAKSA